MKREMFLILILMIILVGIGFVNAVECIGDSDGGINYNVGVL